MNSEPSIASVKRGQGVAFSQEAARTVLEAGMTPLSREEAMASLRRAFPPRATVYTVELTRPTDDADSVAVFGKVKLGGKRQLQNYSWHLSRVGAYPLAGDGGMNAVRLDETDDLLLILERALWLEPTVELPLTRLQRWRLRRARQPAPAMGDAAWTSGFFEHTDIR